MCKTAIQWHRLRKKYDMLFHSLKFKEFKPYFTILCKSLESTISNNIGILLEGIQKLVRIKEMFELQRFELREAIYEFIREFLRCQNIRSNKGEAQIIGSRIMES